MCRYLFPDSSGQCHTLAGRFQLCITQRTRDVHLQMTSGMHFDIRLEYFVGNSACKLEPSSAYLPL
jgi:hypothetical protein